MTKKTKFRTLSASEKMSFTGSILVWCVTLPILSLFTGPLAFVIAPVCIMVGLSKLGKYVEEVEVEE